MITLVVLRLARISGRIHYSTLIEAFETGAKYALAVGAAAATVGIVIGVVTLTGVGFKISYIITTAAQTLAGGMSTVVPAFLMSTQTLTLLCALIMTGLVCILMGCGIPTTANYIIMVTVAAPTLVQLGVEPLVAHFFVFYYGVLADITPPVALAAYAAAGMAGSDPFRTGTTAFRLGLGKVLVPFVFVFSPSLLLVAKGFNWPDFVITFTGCVMGITLAGGRAVEVLPGRNEALGTVAVHTCRPFDGCSEPDRHPGWRGPGRPRGIAPMESLAAGRRPGGLKPGAVSSSKATPTKKPPEGGFCAVRTESLLAPSVFHRCALVVRLTRRPLRFRNSLS